MTVFLAELNSPQQEHKMSLPVHILASLEKLTLMQQYLWLVAKVLTIR